MLNVNEYFGGEVKSIAFVSLRGKTSVGVMNPGNYVFSATQPETMRIITGKLSVKLNADGVWQEFNGGDHFEVQENTQFDVNVESVTAYLCEYH